MPYRSVVDIGAGYGDDLKVALQVNSGASVHAVEINDAYVDRLVSRGLHVCNLNIERDRLPFPDGTIDLVIANQVLEHVKEVYWIFHEISRVLPLEGKLILGVPNLASLHNRILLALGLQPTSLKMNSAHVRGFTKPTIIQFLEEIFPGGYRLKAFGGSNFYPFHPWMARPLAEIFPTLAWSIFFLFEKARDYSQEFLDAPVDQQLETNYYLGVQ